MAEIIYILKHRSVPHTFFLNLTIFKLLLKAKRSYLLFKRNNMRFSLPPFENLGLPFLYVFYSFAIWFL